MSWLCPVPFPENPRRASFLCVADWWWSESEVDRSDQWMQSRRSPSSSTSRFIEPRSIVFEGRFPLEMYLSGIRMTHSRLHNCKIWNLSLSLSLIYVCGFLSIFYLLYSLNLKTVFLEESWHFFVYKKGKWVKSRFGNKNETEIELRIPETIIDFCSQFFGYSIFRKISIQKMIIPNKKIRRTDW